jgi:hypothetical protein
MQLALYAWCYVCRNLTFSELSLTKRTTKPKNLSIRTTKPKNLSSNIFPVRIKLSRPDRDLRSYLMLGSSET